MGGTLLRSFDRTRFFASKKINCPYCTVHAHEVQGYCSHMVLAAVLVIPCKKHVITLDPDPSHRKMDMTDRIASSSHHTLGETQYRVVCAVEGDHPER